LRNTCCRNKEQSLPERN
jgi:hypothetical protein